MDFHVLGRLRCSVFNDFLLINLVKFMWIVLRAIMRTIKTVDLAFQPPQKFTEVSWPYS